jgi:hypothetical protein
MLFSQWVEHLLNSQNSEALLTISFGLCLLLIAKAIRGIGRSDGDHRATMTEPAIEKVPKVGRKREVLIGVKLPTTPPPTMIKPAQPVQADLQ